MASELVCPVSPLSFIFGFVALADGSRLFIQSCGTCIVWCGFHLALVWADLGP